jgi:diaminopimelate decarboxylase
MVKAEHIYPVGIGRNSAGELSLATHSVVELAQKYLTPLYLYEGATVREQIRILRTHLSQAYSGATEITYAAKAYFSLGMARRLAQYSLGVDVVSLGELLVAQKAGFLAERVHLHGNNKGQAELDAAIAWGVQAIVVDSLEELDFVATRAAEARQVARIWLRITPGLAVDTHPYRQTAHASSKFGLHMQDGTAAEGIRKAMALSSVELTGLHMHLGSQIFETEPYARAVRMLFELAASCNYVPAELSPGGGWGVPYRVEDEDCSPQFWLEAVGQAVNAACKLHGLPLPKLIIEPGRWIVARAGMAVYTIGTNKTTSDGRRVIAVDGGMADNLRPALYHAGYTACVAERPDASATQTVRVVGKFCESGDELITSVLLPATNRGDHLVMPVAGAYQLSMASNYNLAPRPAVLWVEEDRVEVMQKREEAHETNWWIEEDH